MRGRAPQTTSYYSPVFIYAGKGKPLPKRGNEADRPPRTIRRITGHAVRDPIIGQGDLGSEADLIYAGHNPRAKSPPRRRGVTGTSSSARDPIRGAGDLGHEHDPFQRTAKVRKVNGVSQSRAVPMSVRDPVLGTGELGTELDHLNRSPKANRKAGKARPTQESYRDPIKGEGALECYDKFRKGPERPRTPRFPQAHRDPIKGEGELGEFDRITNCPLRPRSPRTAYKPDQVYQSMSPEPASPPRHVARQTSANQVHRDPIKGQGDFSTEVKVRGKKHTSSVRPTSGGRDPICGSADIENQPPCGQHHRRHMGKTIDSDPIRGTGSDLKTYDITKESRARTPRPQSASMSGNPLSGDNCATFDIHMNMKSKSRGQYHNRATVSRNPLTGENCQDYLLSNTMRSKRSFAAPYRAPCNPLTGENCPNYVYPSQAPTYPAGAVRSGPYTR